eukprot:21450-Heterococcus_DN1.PRE.3
MAYLIENAEKRQRCNKMAQFDIDLHRSWLRKHSRCAFSESHHKACSTFEPRMLMQCWLISSADNTSSRGFQKGVVLSGF